MESIKLKSKSEVYTKSEKSQNNQHNTEVEEGEG